MLLRKKGFFKFNIIHSKGQIVYLITNRKYDPSNPPPVDRIGSATPDKSMYSDGYLMILSNKNNPIVEIDFQDMFPISLGALAYDQGATDVEYLSVSTTFAYNIYTLTTL